MDSLSEEDSNEMTRRTRDCNTQSTINCSQLFLLDCGIMHATFCFVAWPAFLARQGMSLMFHARQAC